VLAALVAGCSWSGDSTPSPPRDHGGYTGRAEHVFNTAFRTCYRSMANMRSNGSTSPNVNSQKFKPLSPLLKSVPPRYAKAAVKGCLVGSEAAAGR
jgi:hypothetical protein